MVNACVKSIIIIIYFLSIRYVKNYSVFIRIGKVYKTYYVFHNFMLFCLQSLITQNLSYLTFFYLTK